MKQKKLYLPLLSFFLGTFGQLAFAEPQVTVLSELQQRPGNPAVGPDGTIYFSMHPFDKPE